MGHRWALLKKLLWLLPLPLPLLRVLWGKLLLLLRVCRKLLLLLALLLLLLQHLLLPEECVLMELLLGV